MDISSHLKPAGNTPDANAQEQESAGQPIDDRNKSDGISKANNTTDTETRLEIALKALNAGVWEWNPDTGDLLWSEKCFEIFGLEKGPVSLQSWMSAIFSADKARVMEMWTRITLRTGWFELEFRIHVNNSLRWVRKSGYYLSGNETEPAKVTGVMVDVSDEKDFSDKLFKNQRFFKAIIEDQSELICRILPEGAITFVNRAFAGFFGDTVDATLKKTLNEVIPEKDYLKIRKLLKCIKPTREFLHFEQRTGNDQNKPQVVHWTIRAIYGKETLPEEYQLVGRDVTEIETSREALRKSEEMFRLMAENSNDIISIHTSDKTFEYVSPGVKYILGFTPEELIGSKAEEIVCKEDLDFLIAINEKLRASGEPVLLTLRLMDSGGKAIWFESMIQRQYDNNGESTGKAIAISRNIQSRKLVEEQQKLTEMQLKEANLTKDKFFSIIAHDLRSPFTSILGFARLLNDEYNDFSDQERKSMVKQIQNSTESTFQLLDNLLAWAKTQLGRSILNPESFTLESLITESVKQTTPQAMIKNISIVTGTIGDIALFADQNMIRSVMRNLLTNAVKFSFTGGVIEIHATKENNLLTILVTDHGTGIPPGTLSTLFSLTDQVATTKGTANEKGTGLGLILCREFVERNGGTIHAESEVGKGSRFAFTLPLR